MNKIYPYLFILVVVLLTSCSKPQIDPELLQKIPQASKDDIAGAFTRTDDNHPEITQAISECPQEHLEALSFLLANMPERDLQSLSANFLLNNIKLSFQVMDSIAWGKKIPEDLFLNFILPYVSLHERRDDWREDFYTRFLPLVRDINSPGEATVKLNNEIWDIINVHYSTKRKKADQSPYESMESGLASCTGLSILLIDVCRSVGIPARFVGVPLWADHSGNHSWVEIWDDGWHFIGAGEPGPLDKSWFSERAALANDSEWKYSIYASSYKKTGVIFPPLFDKNATYVNADIVTDSYSKSIGKDDNISLAIKLFRHKDGPRIKGKVTVLKGENIVGEGFTRDEKHDINDFFSVKIEPNETYLIKIEAGGRSVEGTYKTIENKYQFYEMYLMQKF